MAAFALASVFVSALAFALVLTLVLVLARVTALAFPAALFNLVTFLPIILFILFLTLGGKSAKKSPATSAGSITLATNPLVKLSASSNLFDNLLTLAAMDFFGTLSLTCFNAPLIQPSFNFLNSSLDNFLTNALTCFLLNSFDFFWNLCVSK